MTDVHIKGVQKSSMIDYPGKICAVVFLSRCNFRCPFCHNPELVNDDPSLEDIPVDEFLAFLKEKRKWLDGVCITGGEPTLHARLLDFMRKMKGLGYAVKLDTNGTSPAIVKRAIDERLVDFIAMDIKNSKEKYEQTTASKVMMKNIEESVKLIMDAGAKGIIDYEFRTTILPKFHTKEDIVAIADWLKGAKKYAMQRFQQQDLLLDEHLMHAQSYLVPELEEFRKAVEGAFGEIELR